MKEFRGKYYAGMFLHYKPADESIWNFSHDVSPLFLVL
jgi:hypothetical protein